MAYFTRILIEKAVREFKARQTEVAIAPILA